MYRLGYGYGVEGGKDIEARLVVLELFGAQHCWLLHPLRWYLLRRSAYTIVNV